MSPGWSPDLTLNNETLDEQHVELYRMLQDAAKALDGTRAALDAALATFVDALMDHVAIEERLMDETLYPERVRHKSAHELFVADFERMRTELREFGPTPVVQDWVRRRIPEWLSFHVRVNDQPLAAWLARRKGFDPKSRKDDGRRYS
jgi:hemerythrin